ncbi:DUF6456 domain-containing protein [Pseudoroseicyclus tamaricis]|uniref:Helix-turn-helix domain-containing protein n=1 Tax=Pseudoroseicyclus tamaricis TaxID=2705421 RepID=A0A6B2JPN9_9RHOB|nr:DUF6456 domain-containing protein [Pseudoroseicyclus tamaricis]NDV00647.1 helix-turn-helix domain-containing protein [Pseudoroseicyclus tamaricis]
MTFSQVTAVDHRVAGLPEWVPEAVHHYLKHTEGGRPIRALARAADVHASTILRQVRRMEARRDDPLVDGALRRLAQISAKRVSGKGAGEALPGGASFEREARRLLTRLARRGTVLAVARDMDMGVIVSEDETGEVRREATVERGFAETLALRDWIEPQDPAARILRYVLTAAGRAALRDFGPEPGFSEAQAGFRRLGESEESDARLRHMRSALAESPLSGLARRRDRKGKPFLPRPLVAAGERMREDYELSRLGPPLQAAWEAHVEAGAPTAFDPPAPPAGDAGAEAARERLLTALEELGPGLADVALRCCCFLEGMEALERRMGWSARSGKVVLRIALQRLERHYETTGGRYAPMIG